MEKRGDVNPTYTPDLRRDSVAAGSSRGSTPPEDAPRDLVEKLAAQGVQSRVEGEMRRAVEGR